MSTRLSLVSGDGDVSTNQPGLNPAIAQIAHMIGGVVIATGENLRNNPDTMEDVREFQTVMYTLGLAGISPADIATILGVNPDRVSRWSAGLTAPPSEDRKRFAEQAFSLIEARGIMDVFGYEYDIWAKEFRA